MEHRIIRPIFLAILLPLFFTACYYDNKEDLYPFDTETCDVNNVTYSGTVKPIMEASCVSCHQQSNPSGGVRVDTYEELKKVADDGRLWGSINHEGGYSAMPLGGSKLSDCSLLQIQKWIADGSPNN
ncbi:MULTISPECIES: c-type cytochrome domain-containing protein [unclassified Lentimicrobium]|uniref:c-type cytochrome domain-containing protein n=1 Tax=unclassified Lentimicrobium TaxID=2677434 RepID=UPI001551C3F0|nr:MULTISPECIES: c-type cytochrome domain-containing protein [unclassified Lentimicrobium]NPD45450.1 hypothetical protein [Lentimicrobium sp. S6]NPD86853.1 hypothetical protein [Lentimicrobium sp. L6]